MARLHREGVCRGLFFLGCLALPVGLTYGADAMHGFDRSPMTVASPAVRP